MRYGADDLASATHSLGGAETPYTAAQGRADHRRRVSCPMTYSTIVYEVSDRIATITFNRPDRLNAVSLAIAMTAEAA